MRLNYAKKLLRTLGLGGSFRFVWSYAVGAQVARVKPSGCTRRVLVRPRSTDIRVLHEIFALREYGFEWPYKVQPRTIIDAGANVGYATIAMRDRWPEAEVIALEPDRANFEMLEMNCKGLQNVHLVQAGIWSSECSLKVVDDSRKRGSWGLSFSEVSAGSPESVKAMTIGSILSRYNIKFCDLLKVDIEGAETKVFSEPTAPWISKIGAIFIETHGHKSAELIEQLAVDQQMNIVRVGEKWLMWRSLLA